MFGAFNTLFGINTHLIISTNQVARQLQQP